MTRKSELISSLNVNKHKPRPAPKYTDGLRECSTQVVFLCFYINIAVSVWKKEAAGLQEFRYDLKGKPECEIFLEIIFISLTY